MRRAPGRLPPAQVYRGGSFRFNNKPLPDASLFGALEASKAARDELRRKLDAKFESVSRVAEGMFGLDFGVDAFSALTLSILEAIERAKPGPPTTLEELRERIKLGPFVDGKVWLDWKRPIDELFYRPTAADTWAICVPTMEIIERHTGTRTRLTGKVVEVRPGMPAKEIAVEVRAAVRHLLDHELDEQLFVDGARAFDPHPPREEFTFTFGGRRR